MYECERRREKVTRENTIKTRHNDVYEPKRRKNLICKKKHIKLNSTIFLNS